MLPPTVAASRCFFVSLFAFLSTEESDDGYTGTNMTIAEVSSSEAPP
jgi:hypothetical protein